MSVRIWKCTAGLIVACWICQGCWWIQAEKEKADCKRALDVVCGCASVDCVAGGPIDAVEILRRCDGDELRADGYNLHLCIQAAGNDYCRVMDALTSDFQDICSVDCRYQSACDLETACLAQQASEC